MLDVKFSLGWEYKGQRGTETLFHTAIGSVAASLRDWGPAFRAMATDILEPAVDEQFTTGGHGEWAPLAPSTIRAKGHDTMEFDSGRLFRSFREGGADHVQDVSRERMLWGSAVPYGVFQQTGTGSGFQQSRKGPGRGMPMRKILALTQANKRAMRSVLVRQLATIARREGFAIAGEHGLELDALSARKLGSMSLGL
jgi:phage gpG-like protein